MTSTGHSRAMSKFAGTATVTSARLTGESLPRPASIRSSCGSSTENSFNAPGVRPGAANAADAASSAASQMQIRRRARLIARQAP